MALATMGPPHGRESLRGNQKNAMGHPSECRTYDMRTPRRKDKNKDTVKCQINTQNLCKQKHQPCHTTRGSMGCRQQDPEDKSQVRSLRRLPKITKHQHVISPRWATSPEHAGRPKRKIKNKKTRHTVFVCRQCRPSRLRRHPPATQHHGNPGPTRYQAKTEKGRAPNMPGDPRKK
jgi:hypothetical protein